MQGSTPCTVFKGGVHIRKKLKRILPILVLLTAIVVLLALVYYIHRQPYEEAEKRNNYEDKIIDKYLDNDDGPAPDTEYPEEATEYMYSDIGDYSFRGNIDSILVIDKINLKKAVIRGNTIEDNDYNLSLYYFVTADLSTTLDGNYIIYGHSSQVYGHSFNRLDELQIGDTFYLIQNGIRYNYQVEAVDRALRSESQPYFPDLEKRVTLVSCEKHLAEGYSEKRVIIVRAANTFKEKYN